MRLTSLDMTQTALKKNPAVSALQERAGELQMSITTMEKEAVRAEENAKALRERIVAARADLKEIGEVILTIKGRP